MKSTKLEEYLTLLQILLSHGPIQLTEIESFVSLKRIALRKDITFLLQQKVIEKNILRSDKTLWTERNKPNKSTYRIVIYSNSPW